MERAEQFGTNPKLFLSAIQKLTRENPCLLKLLSLRDSDDEMLQRPVTADRASQTAIHPVEKVNYFTEFIYPGVNPIDRNVYNG